MGAIEAWTDAGKPVPPITGEDLNGFLRKCKDNNVNFFAEQYPPEIGLRSVEMAVQILSGEPVYKHLELPAKSFDKTEIDKYFMPDYNDDLWTVNEFPQAWLDKMGFKTKK
jgi:ribose transport system substrate-binding protein